MTSGHGWETQAGLTKSHAAWLKNDSPGNVACIFPSLSSQVNSMDLKRMLWIQPGIRWEQSGNMAGWLCTVGEGDILIHVCTPACALLHIHYMNLLLTSRQTSEESHRGAEHQHISITYCLICSCAVCHLISIPCVPYASYIWESRRCIS